MYIWLYYIYLSLKIMGANMCVTEAKTCKKEENKMRGMEEREE